MASSSFSRLVAVPSIALISLGVLAGCGAGKSESSGGETSGQATSSATSSGSESSSASAAASSTPAADPTSEQADSKTEAAIPDGFAQIEAPANDISFAVPENWVDIDGASLADDAKLQEFLDRIPEEARPAKEFMQSQADKADIFVLDTARNADGYTESLYVSSKPVELDGVLPTESELKPVLVQEWFTPMEYKVVDTPLGKAVSQSYSTTAGDKTIYGAFLYVPSPTGDGNFSTITVSTTNADRCNELVTALLGSLGPVN